LSFTFPDSSSCELFLRVETMPLLMVVSLWYLGITSVLTFGQFFLERHFNEGKQVRTSFTQRITGRVSMRGSSAKLGDGGSQ